MRTALVAAALIVLGAGPALAQPGRRAPRDAAADNRWPDRLDAARGATSVCRSDRYFVAVPTFAPLSGAFTDDGADQLLAAELTRRLGAARTAQLAPTVEPVLERRQNAGARGEGHLRFYRIRLGRTLNADAACMVVDTLRGAAKSLAGGGAIYVGRECVGVSQGGYDPRDAEWHLSLMGNTRAAGVEISLVDAGFVGAANRRWSADSSWATPHAHGADMRALALQVAVSEINDIRVLDPDGQGDLADVARGIDEAVFGSGNRPQVINLSIGWPPELERIRQLAGRTCTTEEDPAGEAVRYALAMARLRDRGRLGAAVNGPTAIVAAAGNRPALKNRSETPVYGRHFDVLRIDARDTCAKARAIDLFYPAQWTRRATCIHHRGRSVRVGDVVDLAVGATDARDRASPLTLPVPPPDLWAPGVNVDAGARTLTGSSVSAALTSAAVAREMRSKDSRAAIAAVVGAATKLSPRGPGRLTLGTARSGTASTGGAPARTVSGAAVKPWTAAAVGQCEKALRAWMRNRRARPPTACPSFLTGVDQYNAGGAGPQPPTLGCPDCLARFPSGLTGDEIDLDIELASSLTAIADPHLIVRWPDGKVTWHGLDDAAFTPGATFALKGIELKHPTGKSTLADLYAKGSVELSMKISTGKTTTIDIAVLPAIED